MKNSAYNYDMGKLEEHILHKALIEMGHKYLKPVYRSSWSEQCPVTGYCYVVCELACHFDKTLNPYVMKTEKGTHWFLRDMTGSIVDYTVKQFNDIPDYNTGRKAAFLTKSLSKRAIMLKELYIKNKEKTNGTIQNKATSTL
jgi:hypothetical protein